MSRHYYWWCVVSMLLGVTFLAYLPIATAQCTMEEPCRYFNGVMQEPLVSPTLHTTDNLFTPDENGILEVDFVVMPVNVTFDWLTWTTRGINGAIPGPTLMVKPGDKLRINMINALPRNPETTIENRLQNSVNLHTHGLHVSSNDPADDVLDIQIHPGFEYHYEYDILEDQTPGSFWYHPHFKGSSMLQINGGMAGAIIVMDDPSKMPGPLADISCPDNCENDIVMVCQHVLDWMDTGDRHNKGFLQQQMGGDIYELDPTLTSFLESPRNRVNYYTVNGQLMPELELRTGRVYRLRIINAAGFLPLEVTVEGCDMWLLAMDGVYLPRPELRTTVAVTSASRADIALRCNDDGPHWMRSSPVAADDHSFGGEDILRYDSKLMALRVRGRLSEDTTWTGEELDLLPLHPEGVYPGLMAIDRDCEHGLREVGPDCIWGRYTMEFGNRPLFNREVFLNEVTIPEPDANPVVEASTEPRRTRYRMPRDAVVEFTVLNTERDRAHILHIHVNHFQVVSYEAYDGPVVFRDPERPGTYMEFTDLNCCEVQYSQEISAANYYDDVRTENRGLVDQSLGSHEKQPHTVEGRRGDLAVDAGGYVPLGQWRDTIPVPPLAKIKLRYYAHELLGPVLTHCHIQMHSDDGMAMLMEVVEHHECARPDTDSNEFMAGACRADDAIEPTGWGEDPEAGPEPECKNGVYTPVSECGGTAEAPCEDCWLDYCPSSTNDQLLDCVRTLPEAWVSSDCLDFLET